MSLRPVSVLAVLCFVAVTSSGHAEERYRLEKTENGYVRMDTTTGAMSICTEASGSLVCRAAADERTALLEEVDRLQTDLKALQDRVAKLETSLSARLQNALPSEEEFERTMSYMERFLRGFVGIVKDLDREAPADPGKI